MTHLLFVAPSFPPFPGGGERYVRSLALALSAHGNRVTIVTSTGLREHDFWAPEAVEPTRTEVDGPLRIIRCPLSGFPGGRSGLFAWRKLMVLLSALPGDQAWLLRRMARFIPPIDRLEKTLAELPDDIDLVHAFNISWEHSIVAAWELARRRGRPLVVTPFAHLGTQDNDRVARNSTMDHQRQIMSSAAAVLCLTRIEEEQLTARGIRPARVMEVGSGLDPLPPQQDVATAQGKLDIKRPFVLFIGRASYDKGALHAVQAMRTLQADQTQPVALVLAGQTTPEFDRAYSRLPAADRANIRPLGVVSEAEKHALLEMARMLLLPSRSDSFGIVLLEAWAHGLPVIGAASGGIPGVIDEGQNGLLVPFGDVPKLTAAIGRLLSNPALAKTMGLHGRRKVADRYTWDRVANRVAVAYGQIQPALSQAPLSA